MCVCMSVGICMHLCVQTRSNVGSLCHSLFTEAELASLLNSEMTGTISLACSTLPVLKSQADCHAPSTSVGYLGSEYWSSCLDSKHFIY